jgi:hypothetical protein
MGQPGLTPGVPDLIVLGPRVPGVVGFIELKRERNSKRSDAQIEFAQRCERLGVPCVCTVGRDAPIDLLEQWGVVVRRQAS